jgi:fatty-acid desaturase
LVPWSASTESPLSTLATAATAATAATEAPVRPWSRPWYWCAAGEIPTLTWIIFIHVAAVAGIILLPLPSWPILVAAGALLFLGGLGTTVAYHRTLAHAGAKLNPLVEQPLLFFAVLNGSGTPRSWVTFHRHHHRHSDTDQDISSPDHGMMWAHLRWLWQAEKVETKAYAPDMLKLQYRIWDTLLYPTLALSLFGGLLLVPWLGWEHALAAAVWIGPVRLVWALHTQCTVNSVCHLGAREEHGTGHNVVWLALIHLFQGENWHANHHREPGRAKLGLRWYQVDVGWYTLVGLRTLGLAKRLRA